MKHQDSIKTSKTPISDLRNGDKKNLWINGFNPTKKRIRTFLLLFIFLSSSIIVFGHGVTVSGVRITGQNSVLDYKMVEFDLAWNNSWRISSGVTTWDACWVFVKYRKKSESTWNHALLNYVDGSGSGDGHTEPAGSNISSSNDNGSGNSHGVFIYRSSDMAQGNVSYANVRLRWEYGDNGLADNDSVEVSVFAIEMVYVPKGSFYVGDGTSTDIRGQFESGTSGAPLLITSEGALTLGGGGAGSLGNNNASGMNWVDDFNDGTSKTLPAAFPKGYNDFYCMKYEITQQQYVEFLNRLTYTQQTARAATSPNAAAGTGALVSGNSYYSGIDIMTPGVASTTPAVYACNLDGDANYNESNDGQNKACNYLCWYDVSAYLDWAALRPMTELEYEKACRGDQSVIANEYAWGTTNITQATGISNAGANNETVSNSSANANFDNHAGVQGPLRSGCFGQGVNTREGVGASFWGIMDLSGNVREITVTVGNSTSRTYTGIHGDGILDASGDNNVSNWSSSIIYRGGGYYSSNEYLRVSDRYKYHQLFPRYSEEGGRGVRSAP